MPSTGTPIIHIILTTATTLMVTFHSTVISAIAFIISTVAAMRLAIGEGDIDPFRQWAQQGWPLRLCIREA